MSPIDRLLRCLVFSSFLFLPACRPSPENEEQDDPSSQPVPITVARVAVTTLRPSIDLIGTMTAIPEQLSIIATQVSGLIEQVLVVEGQSVHTGEVLVVLDSRRAQSRLAGARAVAEKARAVLTRLEHGPRPEEIEAALARAEQLSAVARSLSSKFEALGELHDKKDVSDVEYGQAKARLEAAQAESRAARARLRMLQAGTRQEEIAEARAELARAEADAASAALAVEFCTIVSPIAGVVTSLTARQGTYVSPVDILATVLDNSTLFVQVRLPSAYLPQVDEGTRADVQIRSVSEAVFGGVVARLGAEADPISGNVNAFVRVANRDGSLRPGLACRLRLWLPELGDALVIPVAAVADRNGISVVTVIRKDKAFEHEVMLGVVTEHQAQVLEGLQAGDLVATEGGYALPEGCPVRFDAPPR